MRSLLILLAASGAAHAESWKTRETIGLDISTIWEPNNRDAFGAGPLFRVEWHGSKLPDWLDLVTRWGVIVDSADRALVPLSFGLVARFGGPYATAEGIGMVTAKDDMTEELQLSWAGGAAVGWRLGVWDLRTTWLRGAAFEGNVWMFSIGRDVARLDATVKRTML